MTIHIDAITFVGRILSKLPLDKYFMLRLSLYISIYDIYRHVSCSDAPYHQLRYALGTPVKKNFRRFAKEDSRW